MILPTPATPGSIHIRHRFWPDATLLGPHQPRLTERLRILQQFAPSIGKVVLRQGIEIPAETAQTSPIRGRGGHFEEADPIPEYLDPDMRAHDYTVHRSVHVQPVDHAVGYLHLLPVHLHSHLLPEIHLRVAHLRDIERIYVLYNGQTMRIISLTLMAIVFVQADNLVDLASLVTRMLNVCPVQSLAN